MIVAVGSTNPVKIKAVRLAFRKVYPDKSWFIKGVEVDSQVSKQPKSDEETLTGAINRAKKAISKLKADFGVGLEGGLQKVKGEWFDKGWCVVVNKKAEMGIGSSVNVHVPKVFFNFIEKGLELGIADDIVLGTKNSKYKDGHFGIMTNLYITRTHGYTDAVISALARFLNPQFYR